MREDVADLDHIADSGFDFFDLQEIVGGNAILLTARFNDCEHFLPFAVRSALMNRLWRFSRLFVSLRVQKTSGAEEPSTPIARCP
jgi:hypothetical protein